MGYKITLTFHPRREGGGYDTDRTEEQVVKVGKPFEETPIERCAAVIMSQMARRDVWVIDVKPVELVRTPITFKECKDGRGIVLKNKKFSFNDTAQLASEDLGAPPVREAPNPYVPQPHEVRHHDVEPHETQHEHRQPHEVAVRHPHELLAAGRSQQSMDDLYGNPNKPVPVVRQSRPRKPVNQKRVLYHVYFEPYIYESEAKRLKLRFAPDKKYPVHEVIPDASGRLDNQKLALTDDLGRVVEVEDKFFTSAGVGLTEDRNNRFSGTSSRGQRRPKLAFEDEMFIDTPDPNMAGVAIRRDIPLDDGTIPDDLLQMPDIRSGR